MTTLAKQIIIGVIILVVLVVIGIGVLLGMSVTSWKTAVRSGNEAAAIQDMKTIAAVEVQYYNTHNRTFGSFEQLVKDGFDARFSSIVPNVDGYVFILKVTPKTTTQPSSYVLTAVPQSDSTGNRHFYLDSNDNLIRFNADQPAGPTDPSLVQ